MQNNYQEIQTARIQQDPNQPRKGFSKERIEELAISILEHGLLNAIEVTKEGDGFMVVCGAMRLEAMKKLGFDMIPCKVIEISEADRFARQLSENIQRNDLLPGETANAVYKLWKSTFGRAEGIKN